MVKTRMFTLGFRFSKFVIRICLELRNSDFGFFALLLLPLMHDEFVSVRIAKLRHPANGRFDCFAFEGNAARFQFLNYIMDIGHLERHGCSITGRFPRRVTTNADCG